MNKIPLSGFCLLLKSRHKHLFRIMRITYMLLFAAIFCLHAENAISQKITLQGDNLSVKDYHPAGGSSFSERLSPCRVIIFQ